MTPLRVRRSRAIHERKALRGQRVVNTTDRSWPAQVHIHSYHVPEAESNPTPTPPGGDRGIESAEPRVCEEDVR